MTGHSASLTSRCKVDHPAVQCLILILLGLASYSNSFDVPLQYDDFTSLRKTINGSLKLGLEGGLRWFTDLTFSLNRLAHGELVAGYHLVNLSIHLGATLCLYGFVRQSIKVLRPPRQDNRAEDTIQFLAIYTPFATAALFVCHPIQTQAVTYIAQRYTSLATALYLAAMYAYIKARISFADNYARRAMAWGVLTVVAALLAMMSKEIAFTLPPMLVLLEIMLFRGRLLKRPWFLAAIIGLAVVIPLQSLLISGLGGSSSLAQKLQRVSTEIHTISRGDYFLTQLRVIATYLRLMVLPVNQNLDYDYPLYHSITAPPVLASLALHLALFTAATVMFMRSRKYLENGTGIQGIYLRLGTLGICWFYLALLVESSIIPIRDVINEHRLYLPSGGILLLAASLAGGFAAHRPRCRNLLWGVTILGCLALMSATVLRNRVWHSELTMWQDVLTKSPNKPRAQFNVGFHLSKRFQQEAALPYLVRALELDPSPQLYWLSVNGSVTMMARFAGRSALGLEYQATPETVKPEYMVAWTALSHNNLGLAYEHLGNLQWARNNFTLATTIDPSLDLGWLNLAIICARMNDRHGYDSAYARLAQLNPTRAKALSSLGLFP